MLIRASCFALCLLPLPAAAQDPLSAIDWLKQHPPTQIAIPLVPERRAEPGEPPVTSSASTPNVSVTPLDAPTVTSVGLLPSVTTGFPASLWQGSEAETLARSLRSVPVGKLPAMQALLYTLLLAEAEAPNGAKGDAFLAARIARLLDQGAVEAAEAMLERAGKSSPALFALWFETALLTGRTDTACAEVLATPHFAPGHDALVYCHTLTGDWNTAVTVLNSADILGLISDEQAILLTLFLDPETGEDGAQIIAPKRPTALQYRLLQAIGEAPATSALPRPFATLDIGGDAGWRAQIEAAERLARAGTVSENQLLGIYSERKPAASGGVWDRVSAVQKLDASFQSGNPEKLASDLARAWSEMGRAGLSVPFARMFAPKLKAVDLPTDSLPLARQVLLLSPAYETAAQGFGAATSDQEKLLLGIAQGTPELPQARTDLEIAIVEGFTIAPPDTVAPMLQNNRLGELILSTMSDLASGAAGNVTRIPPALATLRALGLEDTARRTALQLLLPRPVS